MGSVGVTDNKAIRELRDTLGDLNNSVKKFNRRSTWLSVAMAVLTVAIIFIMIFK